jgi:Tfp pilus assembly protein PilE
MRWISGVVLALGLLALVVSTWMWQQAVARSQAAGEAEAELQQREQALEPVIDLM